MDFSEKNREKINKKDNDLSDDKFQKLCAFLVKKFEEEDKEREYAKTKHVLALVGKGILLAGIIFMPGLSKVIKPVFEENYFRDWKLYNEGYLRRTLKRLEKQKLLSINKDNNSINLTKKGREKIIKQAINELDLVKQKNWDGKWRLVIYDIPKNKDDLRKIVRSTLKRLNFFALQESVYITPYQCQQEIDFLKEFYGLENYINLLLVSRIDNDFAYRQYFGLT